MLKAIELANKIRKDLSKNWLPELEESNLHKTFESVYSLNKATIVDCNTIVCFIIFAYSPDSTWLNLKSDRLDNKIKILSNMDAEVGNQIYQDLLYNKDETIGMSVFNYLEDLKDWKWRAIFDLLDYSSKMFRFATAETEEEKTFDKMNKEGIVASMSESYSIDTIAKVNKEKGLLLDQAISKRKQADTLLDEIRKDYVSTDQSTQADFQFNFTDTAKKKDIMSWRDFIKSRNETKKNE